MNEVRRAFGAVVLVLFVLGGCAHGVPLRPVQAAPDQLKWVADPRGYQQTLIVGDPAKPGMYAAHIRFPANLRIAPHFHPDERIVTVLSGTVHFGYGERFDESQLRALPAGSVWTDGTSALRLGEGRGGPAPGHRHRPVGHDRDQPVGRDVATRPRDTSPGRRAGTRP